MRDQTELLHALIAQLKNDLAQKVSLVSTLESTIAELRISNQSLAEEKTSLNQRLDSIISCTQQGRVDSNLNKLEIDSLSKQIEQLKMSEGKLKRQVNLLKSQLNDQIKSQAENSEKYTKEMETNRVLQD